MLLKDIHKRLISNETEGDLVEDPLSMHRTGSNEKPLFQKFHL